MRPLIALLTPVLLIVLTLAGCGQTGGNAGATSAGAQAVAACEKVNAELDGLRADVESIAAKVPDDLAGAKASLDSAAVRVTRLGDEVSDPTVRGLVQEVGAAIADLQNQVAAAGNNPIQAAPDLLRAAGRVKDAVTALSDFCKA